VRAISNADHAASASITDQHVHQRMPRTAMPALDIWKIGNQKRSSSAWRQKKTGAPTLASLVFRLNWSSPELDQIVAKR
jgi:hypothetical protein